MNNTRIHSLIYHEFYASGYFIWQINDFEVQPGKRLKVNISVANVRLFVGNIPKQRSKEEIQEEFSKLTGIYRECQSVLSPDAQCVAEC